MKLVTITVNMQCRDDITDEVIDLIGGNTVEHVCNEFERDWEDWADEELGPSPISDGVYAAIAVDGIPQDRKELTRRGELQRRARRRAHILAEFGDGSEKKTAP